MIRVNQPEKRFIADVRNKGIKAVCYGFGLGKLWQRCRFLKKGGFLAFESHREKSECLSVTILVPKNEINKLAPFGQWPQFLFSKYI